MHRPWIVSQEGKRTKATDAGQVDVHQDHGRTMEARQLDAQESIPGAEEPHVPAAREQLLDQLKVGGVVLDIEHGVRPSAVPHGR